jgi:predicted nucleic acid-binding protein
VVAEQGSDLADELWAAASLRISSVLIYPEARAALAAAARAGRLDRRSLRRAVGDLDEAIDAIRLVAVDERLVRSAGALAERHALHGYDAVHLATALSVQDAELLIATWDQDLGAAALAAGRAVTPSTSAGSD